MKLRGYQRQAVDGIYDYFREKAGNCLVVMPTGSGKSVVIGAFVKEAVEQYPETRILIVTHVRELILQNYQKLIGLWPDAPAGIYSAGLGKRDIGARILFCGIQSIHSKAYQLQKVDLVLIDEAHLIPREANATYMKFLADLLLINPYLKVVGLTATPFRLSSGMLHRGDGAMFADIAYEIGIRQLIDEGYLCPPVTQVAETQIDTTNVRTMAGEFNAKQLEAAATSREAIVGVCDATIRAGVGRRGWLVFGCGVDHCTLLRDEMRERGVTCETVFGDTPSAERDRTMQAFKRQQVQCLIGVGVFATGFDAPHCDLIVLARPTKSTGLYIQIVGRGTRLFPGKVNCLVIDAGGNIARHGPIDAPFIKEPGAGGGSMPLKKCPECEKDHPISVRVCDDCGFNFPYESKVVIDSVPLPIMSQIAPPEWVDVDSVTYRAHDKPGKPTSLCVTYMCGMSRHREWVCVSHDGDARQRAVSWWARRAPAGMPVPKTVAEALQGVNALTKPKKIQVRNVGKFVEITGHAL